MTETPTPACWTTTEDGGSHSRTICKGHDYINLTDLELEFLFETDSASQSS
jgi:hypothetical protein